MSELAEEIGERHTEGNKYPENWDWDGIRASVRQAFAVEFDISADQRQGLVPEDLKEDILKAARAHHAQREELFGPEIMRKLEKMVMLQVIDERWRDHLYSMDLMKEGIGLRAYGQKDPLLEYKEESFKMFIELSSHMNQEIAQLLFRAQIAGVPEPARPAVQRMAAYKPGLAAPEAEPEEPMPEKSRKRKVAGPAPKEEDEVHLQPVRSGVCEQCARADCGGNKFFRFVRMDIGKAFLNLHGFLQFLSKIVKIGCTRRGHIGKVVHGHDHGEVFILLFLTSPHITHWCCRGP
jgi:preprotein translocase subunit SecA